MTSGYFFAHYNSVAQFIYDSTDLVRISSANFERAIAGLAGLSASSPGQSKDEQTPSE
jgi:hypothetical protein